MKKIAHFLLLLTFCFSVSSFAQTQTEKEMKLYHNIEFGTSKKDYYKLVPGSKAEVGKYSYNFKPKFYKDSVITELTMTSDPLPVDSFKNVEAYLYNLSDVFSEELGKPHLVNKTISPKKVLKGRFVMLTFWYIGNKYVVISLHRTSTDQYYVTAKMENKLYEKELAEGSTKKDN